MPEEPHKILLDRDLYSVLIKEHFSDSLALLEEMVNYGSNLVPRCFVSSEKKISDVVIVLNFLKQAVSLSALKHYRPAELATFDKKYVNEWRQRFLSVKKVEYKNGTYTIQGHDLSKLTSHPIKI